MKKFLIMAATLLVAVSCGAKKESKTLVLYYSQGGTTKVVAEAIQQALGADIEEILPVDPYDPDFNATISRGQKEMNEGKFPELEPIKANVKDYDVIFVGYPVWFGTYANPIETLLTTVDFSGKQVLSLLVPGCIGLCVLDIATDNVQNPLDRLIKQTFVQLPGANRLDDLPVVEAAGGGHLKIKTRSQAGHAIGDGAPVAHHITLEAPFPAQDLSQQPWVFGGIDTVKAVIRTHDRPGLFFFDGGLKGREINFAQGALVHLRGGAHAAMLLRVGGKMLDAGADMTALNTVNESGCHFACQKRVFGEILEVASAER